MKIAVTAQNEKKESPLDSRFGRCAGFILWDEKNDEYGFHTNTQNRDAEQGAGIQAAVNLVESGAEVLLTGHLGPKAFKVLLAEGIHIYYTEAPTVQGALELYRQGKLTQAEAPDKEGHWL